MEKKFWLSKTFWGTIALAVEGALLAIPGHVAWIEAPLIAIGIFLTAFGYRDAMD